MCVCEGEREKVHVPVSYGWEARMFREASLLCIPALVYGRWGMGDKRRKETGYGKGSEKIHIFPSMLSSNPLWLWSFRNDFPQAGSGTLQSKNVVKPEGRPLVWQREWKADLKLMQWGGGDSVWKQIQLSLKPQRLAQSNSSSLTLLRLWWVFSGRKFYWKGRLIQECLQYLILMQRRVSTSLPFLQLPSQSIACMVLFLSVASCFLLPLHFPWPVPIIQPFLLWSSKPHPNRPFFYPS